GKRLTSTGSDGTARLWDASTGKELRQYAGTGTRPNVAGVSPDEKILVTLTDTLHFLDAATGKELPWSPGRLTAVERTELATAEVQFSPDGRHCAVVGK